MEGLLTLETIDAAILEVDKYYEKINIDEKDVLKVKLGVEETLLRFRDKFGDKQEFVLKTYNSFGKNHVIIEVREQMFDPYAKGDDTESTSLAMRSALSSMDVLPIWRYSRGINVISYTTNKKTVPQWCQLFIAIALAVVCGLLLRRAPENVATFINEGVFSPLLTTFTNLLSAISSPMIFFAIIWGIYSIGDASTFNVLGKKLAGRYIVFTFALTTITAIASIPFFSFIGGGSVDFSSFSDVFEMIIGAVPSNIFTPFAEGNTLQILFLGITIGIAMIFIGEKTQNVAVIAEQIYYLVQVIMNFIRRLVPFFVFGNILDIILLDEISTTATSWKFILVNIIGIALIIIIYILLVCIKLRVPVKVFVKKALPTFIIGFTTASSAAAFSENLDTCINKYGIKKNLANFGLPFGQVVYKPTVALLFYSTAIFCADMYQVPTSLTWFITALLVSVILGIATPPIPGGALASFAVLFAQLGIPVEGLGIIIAMNVLLDFIETPTDLLGGQAMLLLAADRFRLLDKDTLRK